jgi:hypothetical protein
MCAMLQVVGCAAPSADLKADVAAALAKSSSSQLRAILVCSHLEDAQAATNAGLSLEVEQLKAVQEAVQEAGGDHVLVYASQAKPENALADNSRRRSLLTTFTDFGSYTACGQLCKVRSSAFGTRMTVWAAATATVLISMSVARHIPVVLRLLSKRPVACITLPADSSPLAGGHAGRPLLGSGVVRR